MKASLDQILTEGSVMIIDGSMSTALENLGADLNNDLWTAMVLADHPELVRLVHLEYLRAGADCGITCSYQASVPGFMKHGFTQKEAEDLIRRSVALFLEARDQWWEEEGRASGRSYPLCLGSVGPYGAYLADGSEYSGNYRIGEKALRDFHLRRMQLLHEAGADLLLIETQPSLEEVLVEAGIAEELGADFWVSFSCRDGRRISSGGRIADCAKALAGRFPHLRMIGVNCTKPEDTASLIRELKAASGLPVAAYPNSGDTYDPETKTWVKRTGGPDFESYALSFLQAGACAVGGCCTTTAEHVMACVRARERFLSGESTAFRDAGPVKMSPPQALPERGKRIQ